MVAEPTTESGVVKRIVKAIRLRYENVFIWKVHGGPMQAVGMPDLALCVNGLYVGIEVKFQRPGESEAHARNRATPTQRTRIQQIIQAGGMAGVALNEEDAFDIIERGLERLRERHNNVS